MTTQEIAQYFQYHNSNIKLLKIGFDNIRDQIKALYHRKNSSGKYIYLLSDSDNDKIELRKIEKSFSRIISGIQVSWAEECIKRLLFEKNLFTEGQRTFLLSQPSLDQRWYAALKIVFSIAYDLVPPGDENCQTVRINRERRNLGDELVDQYIELRQIIKNQLVPNFSIRNKVQHGEWEYAFKPRPSAEFSQDMTDSINNENIITTTSRHIIVNALYQMLVDLGRFKSNRFAIDSMMTPFEYFYRHYIKKINYEVTKITKANLEQYIKEILEKEIRGEQHKQNKSIILR